MGRKIRLADAVMFSMLAAAVIFDIYLSFSSGEWIHLAVSLLVPVLFCAVFGTMQKKTVRPAAAVRSAGSERISLFDNGGVLRLSVLLSDICYIESDDNYIKVICTDGSGEIKSHVVRSSMKSVEDGAEGSSLMRVHRKYIVNTDKVSAMRREGDHYCLDFPLESLPSIPVTKTYLTAVLARFQVRR